jgi:Response regulators consisting of a CheY-like receiver domain and a winged-helix DNA-binding domain
MNAKVLVVEDDEPIALLLRYNLEAEGFRVHVVGRGDEVEVAIAEDPPDLIILDWMLPGLSGLELCRRLRSAKYQRSIPILILTARAEEADRVRGLTTGADDYVVKPFSVPELMARIRAILRRTNPERLADALSVEDILLDREAHRVTRNGREIRLGPTEFRCWNISWKTRAAFFRARSSLTGFGGVTSMSMSVPSMFISAGFARRSIAARKKTSSARFAVPVTPLATGQTPRIRVNSDSEHIVTLRS